MIKPTARYEKKYVVSYTDYLILKSRLSILLKKDNYSKSNGEYLVRSLYFDTINDMDYSDKTYGLLDRKKIRLRTYDIDNEELKLECKEKSGQFVIKSTSKIAKTDAYRFINQDYKCLLKYEDDNLNKIYMESKSALRRPVTIVEYDREAYINKRLGIRICFDKNIRISYDVRNFFKETKMIPIQHDNFYVLEVKYDEFFPEYLQKMLSSLDLKETSYSKYILSRFNK